MEILPTVHRVPGVIANVYVLIDDDGLTLIDTGLSGSEKRILKFIIGLGYAPRDVRRIIITHSDGDHVGGLAALQQATGAKVYASAIEAAAIRDGRGSRQLRLKGWQKPLFALVSRFFKASPATVDEIVSGGYTFPVLGGLDVVETPGHTPGHISLFAPAVHILFVGDSIIVQGGKMRGSRGMNNWDQEKADLSVRAQAALGARIVCSGHGDVVMDAAGRFPPV